MADAPPPPTPSLRDQKRARTRIAIVEALVERLATRRLEDVPMAELAEAAGVSPATVFNYFPSKADILTHFIQLWSLRIGATCRRVRAQHQSALAAIEALFVHTAEETAAAPQVMLETIAHQARMPADLVPPAVEYAERRLLLPHESDVHLLPDQGLGELLPVMLTHAVAQSELPECSDISSLTLAAASIFFGVPLIMAAKSPSAIAPLYRQQLALLWAGARHHGTSP